MKLIVGLGNPEKKYEKTFHNMGFTVMDKVSELLGVEIAKKKCKALIGEITINGEKIILAKPQTYMNLSGQSVKELMKFYKIDEKDLLVIYDDYDINKGMIRIRKSGSAGTHNGMRSVIAETGCTDFPRIRVGIYDEDSKMPIIVYVLSKINGVDEDLFNKAIEKSAKAVIDFANGKTLDNIMQSYNG